MAKLWGTQGDQVLEDQTPNWGTPENCRQLQQAPNWGTIAGGSWIRRAPIPDPPLPGGMIQ